MVNRDLDDAEIRRVERNVLLRQLKTLEQASQGIRNQLEMNAGGRVGPADNMTRMRTDQIEKIHEQHKITDEHYSAALMIRRTWEALGRGLTPSASPIAGMVTTRGSAKYQQPFERMSEHDKYICSNFYMPWAKHAAKIFVFPSARTRISILGVVTAVVVDNFGPYQLEIKWELPRGKANVMKELRRGLDMFFDEYEAKADHSAPHSGAPGSRTHA